MWSFKVKAYTVSEKRPCVQRFDQNSQSKNRHNSVKIHSIVMGLDIQGHLMTLNKFVKCLRKGLARKGLTKKGHNSVKIHSRVMGLDIQGHLMTLNKCVKFQSNSIHSVWEKALHAKVWPSWHRQRGRRGDYISSPISSNRRANKALRIWTIWLNVWCFTPL